MPEELCPTDTAAKVRCIEEIALPTAFTSSITKQRPIRVDNFSSRLDLFFDWILEDAPENFRVLDIGANNSKHCPEIQRIFDKASYVCGVDPDAKKLADNPFLDERHGSVLEEAPLESEAFDVALSVYVAEHVENPDLFLKAAFRALKPGASLYMLTPNAHHYFAIISGALKKAGMQDQVLKMVRDNEEVDDYHYPAFYKLNSPKTINAYAAEAGFTKAEYRYSEHIQDLDPYFPGPTKLFPRAWNRLVALTGQDQILCNLMVRLHKPASA
jgi:SAM-dependent methyltransferase